MDGKSFVELNVLLPDEHEAEFTEFLEQRMTGQSTAKEMLKDAHRTILSPMREPGRPLFIAMLLGPSRTGKSLAAELLAEFVHGNRDNLVRINMSLYKEKHQITQLIGAPPSYVGYEHTPRLSDKMKTESRGRSRAPVTIYVLEEFEKMVPEVEDIFMGIFDKGRQELANGTVVSYTDSVFICTSNLGMKELVGRKSRDMGFRTSPQALGLAGADVQDMVYLALAERYTPEFLNRIDQVVVYEPLSIAQVRRVVTQEIRRVREQILVRLPYSLKFELAVDRAAEDFLFTRAIESAAEVNKRTPGAGSPIAELKRVINKHILRPIAGELIKHTIGANEEVVVSHLPGRDSLTFRILRESLVSRQRRQQEAAAGSLGSEPASATAAAGAPAGSKPASTPKEQDISVKQKSESRLPEHRQLDAGQQLPDDSEKRLWELRVDGHNYPDLIGKLVKLKHFLNNKLDIASSKPEVRVSYPFCSWLSVSATTAQIEAMLAFMSDLQVSLMPVS